MSGASPCSYLLFMHQFYHAVQEDIGKCDSECKTIQRAAEDIVSDHDTDIAEKLWKVCSQHASGCCKEVLMCML